jgi:hypothetical protein
MRPITPSCGGPRRIAGSRATLTSIFISPPTHASWLNQVEVWFSILASKAFRRQPLRRRPPRPWRGWVFTSPRQVRDQIDAFIAAYNQDAQPFEWTKQVVFAQHPRSKYANLGN